MMDSTRRSFIVRGAFAAIALIGAITRRATAGNGPSDYDTLTIDAIDRYCGNYQIGKDHFLGIDRFFLEESQKIVLLISDYQSGIVRRLFPVSETEFVMGPNFNTPSPVALNVHFLKNQEGDVTGLSLLPTDGKESVAERVALNQEAVIFDNKEVTLAGTLIRPATQGPHPAVILLHGSGPLTRDSFGPYPHFFSSLGFAVLVYDKRGTGASTGKLMDASTGWLLSNKPDDYYPDDLAGDALAALHFLSERKHVDARKIGFWGSSEGGMLTTQIAARSKNVAFIINSSGFMGPLWQTILYQAGAILRASGTPKNEVDQATVFTQLWLDVARTGKDYELFLKRRQEIVKDKKPWLSWLSGYFTSLEQMRWSWDHILAFDSLPALKKVTCPVLGVFGELDTSTSAQTAESSMRRVLSEAGHQDFTLRIFPNASHSLAEMPSGNRMAPGVFETLSSWLLARI